MESLKSGQREEFKEVMGSHPMRNISMVSIPEHNDHTKHLVLGVGCLQLRQQSENWRLGIGKASTPDLYQRRPRGGTTRRLNK